MIKMHDIITIDAEDGDSGDVEYIAT